jgi:FKBP-type peptidyl-prolyl cis-trans isomerase FklB
MKNFKNAGIILLIIVALQACNMGSYKAAKIETKADSASYMLGLSVGHSIKAQDIPDINPSLIAKGIDEVLHNDSSVSEKAISEFLNNYFKEIYEKKSVKSKEEGVAFLEANKKKDGVQVTASGLQYKVITEGTGKTPIGHDKVKCHYKGTLINGDKFDSSYDRGQPAEFSLQGMIPGFTEGLQLMKEGGKYELVIPSELAYGPQGASQKIGPYSVLIFEVELLEVIPQTGDEKGTN